MTARGRIASLCATLLLALVAASGAAAEATTFSQTTTIDITGTGMLSPCTNEFVTLQGEAHLTFHFTVDPAGGFHIGQTLATGGVTAVGAVSGAEYIAQLVQVQDVNIRFPDLFVEGFTMVFNIVSPGPEPNFLFHFTAHVVVSPGGQVTFVGNGDASCTGA
jgi:hypothetical protein